MEKIKVAPGIIWLSFPEIPLNILCGAPMDSVKHLMQWGLIKEIEKEGVVCETGPQAILLSDLPTQGGQFWNLAEFPVLHMMYKQGMVIPEHPNNTGQKPVLLGMADQLEAQSRYIFRGTYGLSSMEELLEAGYTPSRAKELWSQKRRFHFDQIKPTSELLDLVPMTSRFQPIAPGLELKRNSLNIYEFRYKGESQIVDLNVSHNEGYRPSYHLGYHKIDKQYFSIIHSGEGNGWDKNQPCMGSLICFQGKIYLIDCGPNIQASLASLGICVNEIEGIFHTHAHDDHFAGIMTMMKADRKLKYYSTPAVRLSVQKKLSALLGQKEDFLGKIFDIHDLKLEEWNDVDGLEVRPVHSPHPVETVVLFFRTAWAGEYKSYAHLADTVSMRILKSFVTAKPGKSGVSQLEFDRVCREYLHPVDLKKVDIGGGMIHGEAVDFTYDRSSRIILSHRTGDLTDAEKEIGSNATFGMEDVLIPGVEDYHLTKAREYLFSYFPDVPEWSINMLLNNPIVSLTPGAILLRKDEVSSYVYLMLSGFAEYVRVDKGISNVLTTGSLIGEVSGIVQKPVHGTFRSSCYSKALKIPMDLFFHFISYNHLDESLLKIHDIRSFIQNTELLGSMLSYPLQDKISREVEEWKVSNKSEILPFSEPVLYLLSQGEVERCYRGQVLKTYKPGEYFCIENILCLLEDKKPVFTYRVTKRSKIYKIPGRTLENVPVIQSTLLENYETMLSQIEGVMI